MLFNIAVYYISIFKKKCVIAKYFMKALLYFYARNIHYIRFDNANEGLKYKTGITQPMLVRIFRLYLYFYIGYIVWIRSVLVIGKVRMNSIFSSKYRWEANAFVLYTNPFGKVWIHLSTNTKHWRLSSIDWKW